MRLRLFLLRLTGLGQFRWRVIHFATAGFLHFLSEGRSVVTLARQLVGLPLVVPAPGIQTLCFLEMRNSLCQMSGLVELLSQSKFGGGQRKVWILRSQLFPQAVFTHGIDALV